MPDAGAADTGAGGEMPAPPPPQNYPAIFIENITVNASAEPPTAQPNPHPIEGVDDEERNERQ